MAGDKEWDGIKQADNQLPAWYVISFIGTVIFAIVYLVMYHVVGSFNQYDVYAAEVAAHNERFAGAVRVVGSDENPFSTDDAAIVAAGRSTYASTCAICHGQDGQGGIGPNLADGQWYHGGSPKQVFDTINDGISMDKALYEGPAGKSMMPPHSHLGNAKIWELVTFFDADYGSIQH